MLNIKKILFPTDFSDCSRQTLTHALLLAERNAAELHMLHAIVLHDSEGYDKDHDFASGEEIAARLATIADQELDGLAGTGQGRALAVKKITRRGIGAADVILEYADEEDVDLIVMGTQGRRHAARLLLGSVAEEVVRLSSCPVLTRRMTEDPQEAADVEHIVVPIDFSPHSQQALAHAKALAATYEAELDVLHVVDEPPLPFFYASMGVLATDEHRQELESKSLQMLRTFAAEAPGPEVDFEAHVAFGRPAAAIADFAEEEEADLVVIATHGLTGLDRFLIGSTAESVVRLSPCPVFTVKSFGRSLVMG